MAVTIKKAAADPKDSLSVGSVRSFLKALEEINSDLKSVLFFRGHESHAYSLKPSIYRNSGWIKNEDVLFKELVLRCPNEFVGVESTFQMLVKMQHYSLPTRLLDVTLNPLVALYFACLPAPVSTESGEVIVFRFPKDEVKYFDSDTVSVISNISRRPQTFTIQGNNVFSFNHTQEAQLLLHEIKKEKPYFEPKIDPLHLESVVCVKPKLDNARIIRQDGAFLLFGIQGEKTKPANVESKYIIKPGGNRIIIKNKGLIRHQLESLGITQGTIFPEIDRVAEYIRQVFYQSKPK